MKKIILSVFIVSVLLCAIGLAQAQPFSRTLVVYFSATGTTKAVAQEAVGLLGADLYEIVPAQPYTEADLAYYTNGRCDQEQADPSVRPCIAGEIPSMGAYDTVLIGYPIWHGQAPRIICTFLEKCDLSGKRLACFCTSHSSGLGSSAANLQPLVSASAVWLESRRFSAGASQEDVKNWLDEIGIKAEKETAQVGQFDFQNRTVLLNSGYTMPILGLGTYALDYDTCVQSVMTLIRSGGRLIDTAYMYGNEDAVGEGVRRAMAEYGVKREEILDIGYIDMMLLHHPGSHDVEAYRAMEKYVEQGKIRSLGLSNWYIEELTDFLPRVTIMPALVQNEIHPYYQEQEVVPFIQEKGIVVQCWSPLGGRGYTAELLGNETIQSIASAHGVSAAQVILRWDLQRGIVVIPGSSNPDHIVENLDLFGFTLSDEEMQQIRLLDRGEKHDWY